MTFKVRIISFIAAAATLVMAAFFTIAYISLNITENRFSEEAVRGKSVLWQKVIKVQLDQMAASTSSLTRASDVLKALRQDKMQELNEAATPTFNRLSSSEVVSRMQIADNDGNIVFSSPQAFSGATSKQLVKKAIDEKEVFKGIERDDDGLIMTEVVFPLYYRGKAVGAGIYMIDLQKSVENFKAADGSEVHIFTDDGELKYSTEQEQFKLIHARLDAAGEPLQYKQNIGEQILSLVQLPLTDASGSRIGNLLTTTDYTDSYTKQSSVYFTGFSLGILAFILCMVFIYWFMGQAFKPMTKCLNIMGHISSGNLSDDVDVDVSGEFGQLMQGLREMQNKLRGMINDINSATGQIEGSASQLEKVTQESTQRGTTQQQITLQLVENIDELYAASNDVNSSANDSAAEARNAEGEVNNGRNVIKQGVKTIENISSQVNLAEQVVQQVHNGTETIGAVLDVIKGIAEQTNLLALNAAIEAARAGEQGRGFAVVADEVRTLASRTQQSTSEIESMIEALQKGAADAVGKMSASIDMVDKGVEIINEADQSFNAIATTVNSITDKIAQIANAAGRQMSLSQSMHENVTTISDATQKAVEGNRTTVKSSEELISLADNLKAKVSQFTL